MAIKWLPVICLTFAVFVFNTSEFIPIGLLTGIATDFGMTEAGAGMLITVYAWVVALASLPLMLVFAKTEGKRLMLGVVTLFTICQVLSGIASNFHFLTLSRIGVACAHAIFWSIVAPMAVRVAPEGSEDQALGIICAGSSIAMIVGLPLGRAIGLYVGWRTAFLLIACISAVILAVLALALPRIPSDNSFTLRKLPRLIKNPALLGIFLLTIIAITGHFTAYSYIEPFMLQVAGLGNTWTTLSLTVFGLFGIVGSVMFTKYYEANKGRFIILGTGGIVVAMLLLRLSSMHLVTMLILCMFWSLSINSYNLVFQSQIIRNSNGSTIAMAIYSGIYNVGIGTGALVGGSVCSDLGVENVGYAGGCISLVAFIYMLVKLYGLLRSAGSQAQNA